MLEILYLLLYAHGRNCSSVKQKDDETFCITIAAETSELQVQLETVRDRVIPLLLATHIKGMQIYTIKHESLIFFYNVVKVQKA